MKKAFFACLTLLCLNAFSQEVNVTDNTKVNWLTIEEAITVLESGKNDKTFIIDTYTDWCGWCKKMDQTTFTHPEVVKVLNEHFIAVKFDAEAERDIEFGAQTLKFIKAGRKGYHELAAALMKGKLSFPTLVFLNEKFEMIQPIPGYRTAEDLLPIIKFLGEKHYLDTTYNKYMKTYNQTDDGE